VPDQPLLLNSSKEFFFSFDPDVLDLCFRDSTGHRSCYKEMGLGTFEEGLQTCAHLGGHLPNVYTRNETTFLMGHFSGDVWIGLTAQKLVMHICF